MPNKIPALVAILAIGLIAVSTVLYSSRVEVAELQKTQLDMKHQLDSLHAHVIRTSKSSSAAPASGLTYAPPPASGGQMSLQAVSTPGSAILIKGGPAQDTGVVFDKGNDFAKIVLEKSGDATTLGVSVKGNHAINVNKSGNVEVLTKLSTNDLTAGKLSVSGNTVSSSSGDIELNPAGSKVKIGSGKILDMSAADIQLKANAISGDNVEGGVIDATTINTLTSTTVKTGTVTTGSGDLTLTSAGSKVVLGSSQTLDASAGTTTLGNTNLPSGKTLDVSAGTVNFANNQISGDKINGGTIDSTTITQLTCSAVAAETVNATTLSSSGPSVTLGADKILDVSGGSVKFADNAISGDKVEGGTIDATTINTLTSTTVNAGTVSTSTLTSGGSSVSLAAGKTLDVSVGVVTFADKQISGDKINGGTIDSTTITQLTCSAVAAETVNATTLSSSGPSVTLGADKILDVSGGSVKFADNAISGDKVEGGTIDATTINTLTSTTVNAGTVSTSTLTSGGSSVSLAAGKTLDVSAGTVTFANNQISGDKINGGTIDSTTITQLTCSAVAAETVNATTLSSSGPSVTLGADKILDVSGGSVKFADNAISGDKVEGGTIDATTINTLTSSSISVGEMNATSIVADTFNGMSAFGTRFFYTQMGGSTTSGVRATCGSKTLTTIKDRVYKISGQLTLNEAVGTGDLQVNIDGTAMMSALTGVSSPASYNTLGTVTYMYRATSTASHTFSLTTQQNTGAERNFYTWGSYFLVEEFIGMGDL